MRKLLVILLGLLLVAALPAAAAAKPPTKYTEHAVNLFCDELSPVSGTGILYLGAFVSGAFGSDAYLDFWASGDPDGFPDYSRDYDQATTLTVSGGVLSGAIPLIDGGGAPAAPAALSATLTPAGDPYSFDDSFRDGNRFVRISGVSQPLAVAGSLAIPGRTFDLESCFAEESTVSVFGNNPNAYAARLTNRGGGCFLTNAAGDETFLFFDTSQRGDVAFVGAEMFSADGNTGYGAFGEVALTGGSGSGHLETYDVFTGDPVVGSTAIEISLTATEHFDFTLKHATLRVRISGQILDVEGSLTFPGGQTFDLGPCMGTDATEKTIQTNPKGPKPGGKAPANDVPSGATSIKVGGKATQQTRGTVLEAEAPYPCMDFGGGDVIPVHHTVWYKIAGTGSAVTFDTAGSDFDTVIAAYAQTNGSLTPVGCVDDTPLEPIGVSWQAAVTFDTLVGTTYYVQIGSFPWEVPYGNLKVAVR